MKIIKEIIESNKKPKEKVNFLTENIINDKRLFLQLVELLKIGNDVEKGTCADVMKHVSQEKPEIVAPHVDTLIKFINYKASRVKWGVPESIGNLAQKYPEKAAKAISKLLVNTKDESTVVRWCAAFALSEIAKYNSKKAKILIPKMIKMVNQEKNNGVRNVYLKTLKVLEK